MKTAKWIKSGDAGYIAGRLLLDAVVDGYVGHWSVYRHGRKWVAVFASNVAGRQPKMFDSRQSAMEWAEAQ
jgi:hypothetical protein